MSEEPPLAKAYQAVGEYFCAFSVLERELGKAVKVVLGLQTHDAGDFVVAALKDVARKANLVRAAVRVAKNANGSETTVEWKTRADKVIADILDYNSQSRVPLAHALLEPQADGSLRLTKQRLESGQLKGGPQTWTPEKLETKIKDVHDRTGQLQKITKELSTLTIKIPDLFADFSFLGDSFLGDPSAGSSPSSILLDVTGAQPPRPD